MYTRVSHFSNEDNLHVDKTVLQFLIFFNVYWKSLKSKNFMVTVKAFLCMHFH